MKIESNIRCTPSRSRECANRSLWTSWVSEAVSAKAHLHHTDASSAAVFLENDDTIHRMMMTQSNFFPPGEGDVKASTDVDHMCLMAGFDLENRAKIINDLLQVYGNLAGGCARSAICRVDWPADDDRTHHLSIHHTGDGRAIVFCATKKHCDELANSQSLLVEVKAMHGDVVQASRERCVHSFIRSLFIFFASSRSRLPSAKRG